MTLAPPHAGEEARPRGLGYGARIDSTWYRLAVSDDAPLQIVTQDQLAERSADGTNSFENMLKVGFAYVRGDFTGGEGLDRYPRTPPGVLDDTRYFASNNVDLRRPSAGRPYAITLSQRFDPWYTAPFAITDIRATVSRLYIAYADTIVGFTSDADASEDSTFTFPADVTGFDVSDADEGIALLESGELWHKPTGVATWAEVTPDPTGILDNVQAVWLVKGRVLAWRNDETSAAPAELVEIGLGIGGSPGAPTYVVSETVVDTFMAEVLGVEDAGMCILVLTGDRVIRSYTPRVDTAGDPPVLTLESTSPMPKGEQPIAVAYSSGRLLILTSHDTVMRAYSAAMLDERFNFIIGDLTELREYQDVTDFSSPMVRQVVATRDEFLWLINTESSSTDLWRYDQVTTGVHRHAEADAGLVDGLVVWGNRVYVFERGGITVSRTSVFYKPEGWLITPLVNFNLNAPINWTELQLQAFELLAGGGVQVELAISPEDEALVDHTHSSWRTIAQLTSPTVDAISVPMVSETWPKLALRLTLRSHPAGSGSPRVTLIGMRGIPSAQEVVVSVPISVSDHVEAPGRMPVRIPGQGDMLFDSLLRLRGTAVEFRLVSPPLRLRGVVLEVGTPVTYLSHRGSVGRYSVLRVLGDTLPESAAELGLASEGMGVGGMGVMVMGMGGT